MIKHPCSEDTETEILNCEEGDIQPNAVDIRCGKIFKVDSDSPLFTLEEDKKLHAKWTEVEPDEDGYFILEAGYYQVQFQNKIKVGAHECGWVVPRSTLMRNGVVLFSCLYDSGYQGMMVAGLQVFTPTVFKFIKNARLGQYVCVQAETKHLYNGVYNEVI